jgi:S1-C subfamily serine protease
MPVPLPSRSKLRCTQGLGETRDWRVRLILCAALACTLAAQSFAEEGFFADNQPPAVRAAWPSVYAFVCEGRKSVYIASAFLVAKAPRGRRADYFFVTAGHAIADCKEPRRYLAENIYQRAFEGDGITVARPPQRLDSVKPIAVDDAYDLAVVRAEAKGDLRIGMPVTVDDACTRDLHREVYAIGFPDVTTRRSLHLRRQEKSWSKGDVVGLGKAEFRGQLSTYIASTVDTLPGSSGGPVVDARGALVGVVAKGVAGADNGYRYDVDPKKKDDWQTFLAPCTAVLRLLQKSRLLAD